MLSVMVAKELEKSTGGKLLATRPLARQVREQIIARIQEAFNEAVVELNFSGVEFIDYSGADELVVMLMNRIINKELGERYLLLSNLTEWHRENIKAALGINKKHAVLEVRSNELFLLGTVKPMLVEVLRAVYNSGVDTARKLSDATGNEINLSGTKLLQLYQQRLIMRTEEFLPEGGRQYKYGPILSAPLVV